MLYMVEEPSGVRVERFVLKIRPRDRFTLSADDLAEVVKEAFLRYGVPWDEIKDWILCLVSDTAADVTATARALGVRPHACLNHVLDLVIKDGKVSSSYDSSYALGSSLHLIAFTRLPRCCCRTW